MVLLLALTMISFNAFGYSSGTMNCFFELFNTKSWPKPEITQSFEINVMEVYESSIESKFLDNKIRLRYVPGLIARNDVRIASVTMTYDSADAGADVPFVADGQYTFKIGRQGSDLVGAFMNCKVNNLK